MRPMSYLNLEDASVPHPLSSSSTDSFPTEVYPIVYSGSVLRRQAFWTIVHLMDYLSSSASHQSQNFGMVDAVILASGETNTAAN